MAVSIVMPALELAQETGKLLSWRKQEGERVSKGEPLVEIETDKAVVEIESPGDGILAAVSAREGAVIPVGQTIAWLVQPGEPTPQLAASPSPKAPISPKARRLAQERSADISRIKGSGPGGEILASDILAATASPAAGAAAGSVVEPSPRLSSVARLMAERTAQSWTTVPHFFLVREIEASALIAARERRAVDVERATGGVRLTHTDLLVALVAETLQRHPIMNASWSAEGIHANAEVNVAIAMAVTDGVVTGVITHADTMPLADISRRRSALSERALAGRLQPADIGGVTFTISNLGMYGVDAFTAVIVPPQAAILAVGSIADRVVAIEGQPAVRPMVTLTLSCDHRVVAGARAATFLDDLAAGIRSPETHLR